MTGPGSLRPHRPKGRHMSTATETTKKHTTPASITSRWLPALINRCLCRSVPKLGCSCFIFHSFSSIAPPSPLVCVCVCVCVWLFEYQCRHQRICQNQGSGRGCYKDLRLKHTQTCIHTPLQLCFHITPWQRPLTAAYLHRYHQGYRR